MEILNIIAGELFCLEAIYASEAGIVTPESLSFEQIEKTIKLMHEHCNTLDEVKINLLKYIEVYAVMYGLNQFALRYIQRTNVLIQKISDNIDKLNERYETEADLYAFMHPVFAEAETSEDSE